MTKRALETRTLKLEGMTCSACVNSIERVLNNVVGVSATVNFASETAHILAPAEISTKKLIETVKSAGYSAQLLGDSNQFALHSKRSAIALFFALLFSASLCCCGNGSILDWKKSRHSCKALMQDLSKTFLCFEVSQ